MKDIISNVLINSIEKHLMDGFHKLSMQYMGGKCRTRKPIGEYLNKIRKEGQSYYEPFVGSCWILMEIEKGPNYASDANEYLIAMWKAVQKGWIPPSKVSEAQHARGKAQIQNNGKGKMSKELLAFIGFGCSFYAMWFAGYARGSNYAQKAKDSILRKKEKINKDTKFSCCSYDEIKPEKNSLIYCDPPYDNTDQEYASQKQHGKDNEVKRERFDSEKFWEWCRKMSKAGHTVLISEYKAPKDFKCVLRINTTTGVHAKNRSRVEKLFQYKG
jgi:DNA adenine methylase